MTKDEALKMAVDALENVFGKGNKAINALIACKEALKQQEPRMFLDLSNSNGNHPVAQPAQDDEKRGLEFENEHLKKELDGAMTMLKTQPAQECQECENLKHDLEEYMDANKELINREWQGLSDDETAQLKLMMYEWEGDNQVVNLDHLMLAVAQKLKEKNHVI
jgi:predicted phage-related endonuclease